MDKLSITEAIVAMLVEQDGVDATNAVQLFRKAQNNVAVRLLGQEATSPGIARVWLQQRRDIDEIDSIITMATENGRLDLF